MLTSERIKELRAEVREVAESAASLMDMDTEEVAELLDAWRAWALYAEAQGYRTESGHRCNWLYNVGGNLYGTFRKGSHPTPQAAVLAALGTKGETES